MAIDLNDNVSILAPKPTDTRYGPYPNTESALLGIPYIFRYLGLTVGVENFEGVTDFWFKEGIEDEDLVVKTTGGGSFANSRIILTKSTIPVQHLDTVNLEFNAFRTYLVASLVLSHPCRFRSYVDNESRADDAGRGLGTDPVAGIGLILEVVSVSENYRQKVTPFVPGGNLDIPAGNTMYCSVTNRSGVTRPITVGIELLQLEG